MARTDSRTVVVLGAGVGGLVAANELRKKLDRKHRILLVDKRGQHLYSPSLLWLMAGLRQPGQLTKDLRRMIEPGIELVQAEVQGIDPERHEVKTTTSTLAYDYLVVALGADMAPAKMPGYEDVAHNFFSLEGASNLRQALARFQGGRVAVAISSLPYKCPAAPYEAALLIDDVLRRRGVRSKTDLHLFTPEPLPMPVAGPVIGNSIKGMLDQRGIGFHPGVQLDSIDGAGRQLVFKDGSTAGFDLLAAVPPHHAPIAIKESPLANDLGWIPVERRSLKTRFDNVYAVGDITAVPLPNGKLLPKAGVFAHAEALAVASTIAARVQAGREHEFDGVGFCWVTLARGRAGFASGNFYADPEPVIDLKTPGWMWNTTKVLFERYWMGDGLTRSAARAGLLLGSRVLGVPAVL